MNDLKVSLEVTDDGKSAVVVVTSQDEELSYLDLHKALTELSAKILTLGKANDVQN